MSESLRKVKSGDPLDIPAGTFNTFVDAARDYLQRQQGTGQKPTQAFRQTGIVLVKNASGADAGRFAVLGIDSPIFSPAEAADSFANQVALVGVTPSAPSHAGKFAILLEPVTDGEIGMGCVDGVCPAKVNVTDVGHEYADVSGGETILASCGSGAAVILWRESGTGVKWALIRIGGGGGEISSSGFPARIITALGSGAYTVKEQVASAATTFGDKSGASNITAYNLAEIAGSECSSQIAANAIVWVRKHVDWYYFERATNARYKA